MTRLPLMLMDTAPIVLLLVSVVADVVTYFGGGAPWQTTGAWALLAASVGYWITFIAGFRAKKPGVEARLRVSGPRHLLVGSTLACVLAVLILWRWSSGNVVVSSFDGGYPILVSLALLLATYRAWPGAER